MCAAGAETNILSIPIIANCPMRKVHQPEKCFIFFPLLDPFAKIDDGRRRNSQLLLPKGRSLSFQFSGSAQPDRKSETEVLKGS